MLPYILAAARVMSKLATYHMTRGRIIYGLNQGLLYSAKPNYRGLLKTDIRSQYNQIIQNKQIRGDEWGRRVGNAQIQSTTIVKH